MAIIALGHAAPGSTGEIVLILALLPMMANVIKLRLLGFFFFVLVALTRRIAIQDLAAALIVARQAAGAALALVLAGTVTAHIPMVTAVVIALPTRIGVMIALSLEIAIPFLDSARIQAPVVTKTNARGEH